jgi:5-hydroxyisourate hydrolase
MTGVSTHVLDLTSGLPARDLLVVLERQDAPGTWREAGRAATGADGRVRELAPSGGVTPGTYRLRFSTDDYFAATATASFYPEVTVTFRVEEGAAHLHVPLLLGPFGYSTYRGS